MLTLYYYLCIIFYWILSLWGIKAAIYLLFISISSADLQEMTREQREYPSHESLQLHPFFCRLPWWLHPSLKLKLCIMRMHENKWDINSGDYFLCSGVLFRTILSCAYVCNSCKCVFLYFMSLWKHTRTICFPFKSS